MHGRERLENDAGLSLVELIIAVALFLVLLGAVLSVLDSGTRAERAQQARNSALTDLREAVSRFTKDVRQALSVTPTSTRSRLEMQTLIGGVERNVVYEVVQLPSGNREFRRIVGGGAPLLVLDNVAPVAAQPFCYDFDPPNCLVSGHSPPPRMTAIRIELAVEPEVFSGGPITLATDIELRNL